MDCDKVTKKIYEKYGVGPSDISNLSVSKIKKLKYNSDLLKRESDKFAIVKKPVSTIVKGGSLGAGLAGSINTIFPNIVPVLGSAFTSTKEMSPVEKALGLTLFASKSVDVISGPVIIGIGAISGALLYSGYKLAKNGIEHLLIAKDVSDAQKILSKK